MRLFTILKLLAGRVKFGDGWLQVGDILMQWGLFDVTTTAGTSTSHIQASFMFTKAFSKAPLLFFGDNCVTYLCSTSVRAVGYTSATVDVTSARIPATPLTIYWLAIGKA